MLRRYGGAVPLGQSAWGSEPTAAQPAERCGDHRAGDRLTGRHIQVRHHPRRQINRLPARRGGLAVLSRPGRNRMTAVRFPPGKETTP
ncbi:hypothetical protein [Catellatospora methionotrophica]|uniref:hypothetical protein n=1 Tax=Catellatospora methionotrophica TaxID=121620 RepID=UPI00140B7FE5|nr:hypothetical protein [Catellatospora methionotrophica]